MIKWQRLVVGVSVMAMLGTAMAARKPAKGIQESRFFRVDLDAKRVLEPSKQVAPALALDLTSVTTDQSQYWPNEKVFLKVLTLGAPQAKFKAKFNKRDAQQREYSGALDEQGVAVVELMNGEKQKLELGEYRVDVELDGGKHKGSATFAVVEGTLGALSFAHEFTKVTSPAQLESAKGAWFLGNASGAGKRWGNGLNFKNELRADNKPYTGEVDIHSRCMLPGCNGTYAGRSLEKHKVENGVIAGTLDVGGHSGPFQIEVITPKGSLRHQFEGSSHVERDLVPVSGGVSYVHRAGLAPYDKTEQVPGRQIFIESNRGSDDAFEFKRPIAEHGKVNLRARRGLQGVVVAAYRPDGKGQFGEAKLVSLGDLKEGMPIVVDVASPFSFITVGGFADGVWVEGWAVAFLPSEMTIAIEAPNQAGPRSTISVALSVKDSAGHGLSSSGILEAYDNRVAAKNPLSPIGSAIGDGLRNASNAVSSWRDNTGIEEVSPRDDRAYEMEDAAPSAAPPPSSPAPKSFMMKAKGGAMPKRAMANGSGSGRMGVVASMGEPAGEEEAPEETIREGEKKVVLVTRVVTDANGAARVSVTLPPQMGRVVLRYVAVRGLDHAITQKEVDSSKEAAAEVRAPRMFVPGAKLKLPVTITNASQGEVKVTASGPGVSPVLQSFGPGNHELSLAFEGRDAGRIAVQVAVGNKVFDRREIDIASLGAQSVTYSRLEVFSGSPIPVSHDETAVVYGGAGELMHGIVLNMFTTMESWFGHAEALSAKLAASSVIAAAIARGLVPDDGMQANLVAGLDKTMRDLEEAFVDASTGLVKPYPGLAPSPSWSGWVAKNLHDAAWALAQSGSTDARLTTTMASAKRVAQVIDKALVGKGLRLEEFGHNAGGEGVIPVEIDGKVVYRVRTDDAVSKWASSRFLPKFLPEAQRDAEVGFSKMYDVFRFLRAFERTGGLQYLTELARAMYEKNDTAGFAALYRTITRGMILAQEPGMLQGPALLGGVYSTPMAMVRFLELQLVMAGRPVRGEVKWKGKVAQFSETLAGGGTLEAPLGAIARIDRRGTVSMSAGGEALARASMSATQVRLGGQMMMTVELDASRDPLEYTALIAVPSSTSIKQTADILSDYRGQLIYGQQGMGGTQQQMMAVPFRGSRRLELLLEGAYLGSSPGLVAIRHVDNPSLNSVLSTPSVRVE